MRRIHSERPTDRLELTNVKEARPRQPGDMIRVTHAKVDVCTEIAILLSNIKWLLSMYDPTNVARGVLHN